MIVSEKFGSRLPQLNTQFKKKALSDRFFWRFAIPLDIIAFYLLTRKIAAAGFLKKAYALIERAVLYNLNLEKEAYDLSKCLKTEGNLTSERCYSVLKHCVHVITPTDTLFWMKALLDCLKNERRIFFQFEKRALNTLLTNLDRESLEELFSHESIHTLLSKEQIKKVYGNFLERALTQPGLSVEEKISIYQEFFYKNSSRKQYRAENHKTCDLFALHGSFRTSNGWSIQSAMEKFNSDFLQKRGWYRFAKHL